MNHKKKFSNTSCLYIYLFTVKYKCIYNLYDYIVTLLIGKLSEFVYFIIKNVQMFL
jgi:hypothetical protein